MEESYRKGLANHPVPESCTGSREAVGEALTGAHAGWVLSCEIIAIGVPTLFNKAEGNIDGSVKRQRPSNPAQSEAPRTHGNSTRENRETPLMPVWQYAGRLEKA